MRVGAQLEAKEQEFLQFGYCYLLLLLLLVLLLSLVLVSL